MPWMTMEDVRDVSTLYEYVRQRTGCAGVKSKDFPKAAKQIKLFMERNPQANWQTLCRVTDWGVAHKRRPFQFWTIVDWTPWAFRDGWLPEMEPKQAADAEYDIWEAIKKTDDPDWRARLGMARGAQSQRVVLEQWRHEYMGAS